VIEYAKNKLHIFITLCQMSNLSTVERVKIEKLLEMGGGYVLNLSNSALQRFVAESVNLDVYDEKYLHASGSKANRLRALWEKEPNSTVGKLISDLLEYWRTQKILSDSEITNSEQSLFDECSKISSRLTQQDIIESSFSRNIGNLIKGTQKISILLISADPTNASRLRIGEELREIQEKLQLARLRDKFNLEQRMSVRPTDLSQALLDISPHIVHFSGHGTSSGSLCFENKMGEIHPIPPNALSDLFEQFSSQVNCVILNACYSEIQAQAIAKHINHVIGMSQAISDDAAIAFGIGFYQALGGGRSIEEAYKLGCVQISLHGIPENLIPVITSR